MHKDFLRKIKKEFVTSGPAMYETEKEIFREKENHESETWSM